MKTWLITGAGSGLGKALALAAVGRGDRVAGTVRSEGDATMLAQAGISPIVVDLMTDGAMQHVAHSALALLGDIDVLVNNAGRGFTAAVEEASPLEIRSVFQINFFAPVELIQALLPAMRVRGQGHILNVTSISGFQPWSGTGIYCASKFAMEGLGQTLAQEVAPFGIKVTNVQPGGLRTDFNGRSLGASEQMIEAYAEGAHFARRALAASDGHQKGDPAKAAQAILAAVDCPSPPLNLVLGADAILMANQRIARLLVDVGRWAPLGEAIGFDAPEPIL